jgi:hypothetical protein
MSDGCHKRSIGAYPLQQVGFLAKVGDSWTIKVGEHLVAKDGISDLGCVHQVHLKQSGLQMGLLRFVILKGIQQEGSCCRNEILGHENIDDAFDINQRSTLVVNQLGGKFCSLLRIGSHDMLEDRSKICAVSDLLGVEEDLIGLSSFGEACNNLAGNVGTEVDAQCESHIVHANDITKLLAAFKLEKQLLL